MPQRCSKFERSLGTTELWGLLSIGEIENIESNKVKLQKLIASKL